MDTNPSKKFNEPSTIAVIFSIIYTIMLLILGFALVAIVQSYFDIDLS